MLSTNLASILGWLSLVLQVVLANFKAKIHDGFHKFSIKHQVVGEYCMEMFLNKEMTLSTFKILELYAATTQSMSASIFRRVIDG